MALSHTPPCGCCIDSFAQMDLPEHVAFRYDKVLRAPPPTPPELDPQAREPDDNTIVAIPENRKLHQQLLEKCALVCGLPSKPVPSPKWDSVPMLPAEVLRIVYMYCWGPPDVVDCHLALPRGRQDWSYAFYHRRDKRRRGFRPDGPRSLRPDDDVYDIDDGDSTAESFVGTDDGWDDGVEAAILPMPDGLFRRNLHKACRRIVNAKITRIEPRP